MIEEAKVLEVRCDDCRTYLPDDNYCIQRLDDEAQVPEACELMEWVVHDNKHFCPPCWCERDTGHELKASAQGYKSCDCGEIFERAVVVRDVLERL